MQNIIIFKNREIYRRNSDILGIWGENNYETLCFGFYDDFIDGDAILEFEFPDGQKKFVELEKDIEEKFYKILIKSSLLQQEGDIKLELKIINENEIIYKTKIFIMKVLEAINATATFEEDYPDFVTTTTAKLEKLENNKQDKLVAGENITIENGVISATGGMSEEVVIGTEEPTTDDWKIFIDESEEAPEYVTKSVDDLVNYYLKTETYSKEEVNSIINNISTINILVVDTLPTENISTTTIYLLPKETSGENNIYDEYIYVSNAWEKIGDTKIDLTEYATIEMINQYLKTIDLKTEVLKFVDTEVMADSKNPVSGGAVKTYVDTQIGNIETLLAEV